MADGTLLVAAEEAFGVDFRPGPGQVALVEYPGAQEPMTGLVTNGHTEHIAIDLGAQAPSAVPDEPIVVSVYAPDALYRLRGTARRARPDGVIVLEPVHDVSRLGCRDQRVQERMVHGRNPRGRPQPDHQLRSG